MCNGTSSKMLSLNRMYAYICSLFNRKLYLDCFEPWWLAENRKPSSPCKWKAAKEENAKNGSKCRQDGQPGVCWGAQGVWSILSKEQGFWFNCNQRGNCVKMHAIVQCTMCISNVNKCLFLDRTRHSGLATESDVSSQKSRTKTFKMKEIFFALGGINLAVSHCWWQV